MIQVHKMSVREAGSWETDVPVHSPLLKSWADTEQVSDPLCTVVHCLQWKQEYAGVLQEQQYVHGQNFQQQISACEEFLQPHPSEHKYKVLNTLSVNTR